MPRTPVERLASPLRDIEYVIKCFILNFSRTAKLTFISFQGHHVRAKTSDSVVCQFRNQMIHYNANSVLHSIFTHLLFQINSNSFSLQYPPTKRDGILRIGSHTRIRTCTRIAQNCCYPISRSTHQWPCEPWNCRFSDWVISIAISELIRLFISIHICVFYLSGYRIKILF